MDIVFKKYFWVVNVLTLALGGLLVGSTINDYLVARVLGPAGTPLEVPLIPIGDIAARRGGGEPIGDDLIFRRPFNADPLPEDVPPPEVSEAPTDGAEGAGDAAENDGDEIEESELDVSLVGTLVYPDPSMSMATVKAGGSSKLVRVGTELEGGKAKVLQIERRYLLVDEGGKQKYIRLWSQPKETAGPPGRGQPGPPPPGRPAPQAPSAPPPQADWKDGVTKISENEYQISRAMLDEQLQDLSQLGMQARIVPNYRNGKYEGFKLVGVRPNSLYRAIGIRSGDIIKRINGNEINSPNKAIELFEQFKSSSSIAMDVERRGQVQPFQYSIK